MEKTRLARLAPLFFVPLLLLVVTAVAASQETNTTTNTTNVTVTLPPPPNITMIKRGEAAVSAILSGSKVTISYTCFYAGGGPELCPVAAYRLMVGGSVVWSGEYAVDPGKDCHVATCSYKLVVGLVSRPQRAVLEYRLTWPDGSTRAANLTLVQQETETPLGKYMNLLPAAIIAGLAMQYDLAAAGIGGILGVVLVYLLSVAGIAPFNPLVAFLTIMFSVVAIYFSKR